MLLCAMTAKIGCLGLRTFRPMVREINHPAIYQNTTGEKHSDRIKQLKRRVGIRQVVILVLSLVVLFMFRNFALKKARHFINEEYSQFDQPGKYTFGHKALEKSGFGHHGGRHLNGTDLAELEKNFFKSVGGDVVVPKKPLIPEGPTHGGKNLQAQNKNHVSEEEIYSITQS